MRTVVASDAVERAEKASDLTDEQLLATLADITAELAVVNPRLNALWRARLIIYHESRKRPEPPTLADMAAIAGVSEVQVSKALKKPDPLR